MTQELARETFIKMVRDCGNDIVRMRASFEMYINQYLVDYPNEKQLLVDAFKVGIPEKIIQHAGEKDYAKYLDKLGPRFAEAAHRGEEESSWAVATWAMALNRTADYVAPAALERIYPDDLLPQDERPKELIAGGVMLMIVSAGGALGAGLAAILFPLAFMAMGFAASVYAADADGGNTIRNTTDQLLYFVVTFLTAAAVGGAGAAAGWFIGRGSEFPWAGFMAAFGTAIPMYFIVSAIYIPFVPRIVWAPVVLFSSVFLVTYKTAARGGNY